MLLLIWAVVCIFVGSQSQSAVLATVVFLGGIIGAELGIDAGAKVAQRFAELMHPSHQADSNV